MTKEECISLLNSYAEYGDIGIPNLIRFREAMRTAAELLQQPSLPSDLDEAAQKVEDYYDVGEEHEYLYCHRGDIKDAFKAGAEWMAGQFQKIEGELVDWYSTSDGKDYCCGIKTSDPFVVPEGFYIRKK